MTKTRTHEKALCPRCGAELSVEWCPGYKWYCSACDENFYSFEVSLKGSKNS